MLLIGLLLLAFACLLLGLVQASAAWLLGSLAASLAAAVALWLARDKIAARGRRAGSPGRHAEQRAAVPAVLPEVWVIDGRPRYHRQDCPIVTGQDAEPIPAEQASEDGFLPCSLCEPDVTRG